MKALLPAMLFFMGYSVCASGQCEPDTVNCTDEGDPGEFCPRELPTATLNEAYEEVITVIAPSQAEIGDNSVIIEYIEVDSVLNLPPGISYEANAEVFYPDTAYCIAITGTPTLQGSFQLAIYVTPWINSSGIVFPSPAQVVDSTSVVMTVQGPAGIDPSSITSFRVLPVYPNPSFSTLRIGFVTPADEWVELNVFTVLGERIYSEVLGAPPGEHYFEFDGAGLDAGTYFYRVGTREEVLTGKFIKSTR